MLLLQADQLEEVDKEMHELLNNEIIRSIVDLIPDEWLLVDAPFESTALHRQAYEQFLIGRFAHSPIFVKEIKDAREGII